MKNGSFVSLDTVKVLIRQGVLMKIHRRKGMSTADLLILYSEQARNKYGKNMRDFEDIEIDDVEREKPVGT